MNEKREKDEHPAYGMLMFSHVHGGNPNLFGSSVRHDHRVVMTLSHGSAERHLNNDWYSAGKKIVEVEMSLTQFAEAITSMNYSPGVPVTITYTEKDGNIPSIEKFVDKRTQYLDEFREKNKESVAEIRDLIDNVRDVFAKKTMTKKDKENVLDMLLQIENATGSHNTFMAKQFNETTDNIVKEAKGEVEAFVQQRINSLALAALAQEHTDPQLVGKNLKAVVLEKKGEGLPQGKPTVDENFRKEDHPVCPQNFAEHFPSVRKTPFGEYSQNSFSVQCKNGPVEICVYREMDDGGEYAGIPFLQVYLGDTVLFCEKIEEGDCETFSSDSAASGPQSFTEHFPDAEETLPGEWSKNGFVVPCEGSKVEIGVYREPNDGRESAGTLTLRIYRGNDIVFCEQIAGEENG